MDEPSVPSAFAAITPEPSSQICNFLEKQFEYKKKYKSFENYEE